MSAVASSSRALLRSAVCDCSRASYVPALFKRTPSASSVELLRSYSSTSTSTSTRPSITIPASHPVQHQQRRGYLPYRQKTPRAVGAVKTTPSPLVARIKQGPDGGAEPEKSLSADELIRSGRAGEDLGRQQQEAAAAAAAQAAPKQDLRQDVQWLNRMFTKATESMTGIRAFEPCTPTSSRSIPFNMSRDFERAYRRLQGGVIAVNNIKPELKLLERYEKPHYMRQRLASARHRRRFAREVGLKVAAVMKAKSQGM